VSILRFFTLRGQHVPLIEVKFDVLLYYKFYEITVTVGIGPQNCKFYNSFELSTAVEGDAATTVEAMQDFDNCQVRN